MTKDDIFNQIKSKESFLCVGLDTDIHKIPSHLLKSEDPVFEFNKYIIDATVDYCIAYKPNLAFYEALGPSGLESLEKTVEYIPDDIFVIADAKRGDIGNSSSMYAKAFFERMDFDAVTISPYMGHDSILPFFEYNEKWVVVLALTSNAGSSDFQHLDIAGDHEDFFDIEQLELFEIVIKKCVTWGTPDNMMFIVGATKPTYISNIRKLAEEHFFLVPGVGAQSGNLKDVAAFGMNDKCGLIVNSSRAIIYASNGDDFAVAASNAAKKLQEEMASLLQEHA
ncbi:MAG: orotidine-5'-phosphate decarboxylase [Bacteroidetes bacterium]|nr:orotidine-5'-phosphate decarboxylase [Bacteroidota bacterium]